MQKTYIIAEAGVNHNGSLDLAKQLVDAAVETGADAIKFQTFKAAAIVNRSAVKADYQKQNTNNSTESQLAMLERLELDLMAHEVLLAYCAQRQITFLSSPFDLSSLDLLLNTGQLSRLKIASGEITNAPLLLRAAASRQPIILSTGMSTLAEVEQALGVLAFGYMQMGAVVSRAAFADSYASATGQAALRQQVILLHCTTEYPAPFDEVNLRAMETLHAAFQLPVGFSDHTPGINIAIAAVARGAVLIEKHLTLSQTLPGPDHKASLEPPAFKAMVTGIREVELSLGDGLKLPAASEVKNRPIARKSLVAAQAIRQGDTFTEHNLTSKRPGHGISPLYYWDYLGRQAGRDYQADELIEPS